MHKYLWLVLATCLLPGQAAAAETDCAGWLDHSVKKLHSKEQIDLCKVTANRPLLIVNTASHCGYTGQFSGLEKLHKRYRDQGLVLLGFPSNDFNQEADSAAETARICYINYGVTFLMADKVSVKGSDAHPIFKHIAEKQGQPEWNFNKFLVDRNGSVVERFSSRVKPDSDKLIRSIEQVL